MSTVEARRSAREQNNEAIQCDDLVVRYGDTIAVDGVSFCVPQGSFFGFLGPNGAGKSTTISVICTLRMPASGRVRVCGFDVQREPQEVRKRIGVLFQGPSVDDRLTGHENLSLHAMVWGIPRSERKARLERAAVQSGLGPQLAQPLRTYSGGMRRRLELARVMLHDPAVIILDEPTAGLDPQARRSFWAELGRLRREHGITLFLTTHYLEEAEQADAIAIIDHGKIIAQGTPGELKAKLPGDLAAADLEEVFVHLTGSAPRDEAASASDATRRALAQRRRLDR